MPISVTCVECEYHFSVADEFAGRAGRCPECDAVLTVPGAATPQTPPTLFDNPYGNRDDDFDDEPVPSYRRSARSEERDLRDDFDDEQRQSGKFDPRPRIAAWKRTAAGLQSVRVAFVLYVMMESMYRALLVVRGDPQPNGNNIDTGLAALICGMCVVMLSSGVFWLLGRWQVTRTPYVPARSWAKVAFYLALSSVFCLGAFILCCFVAGMMMAGGGGGAGMALFALGIMVLFLGFLLTVSAEACGLMNIIKTCDGLKDRSAAGWAKFTLVGFGLLLGFTMIMVCGLSVHAAQQQEKKRKDAEVAEKRAEEKLRADNKFNPKFKAPEPKEPPPPKNPFEDDDMDDGLDDSTRIIVHVVSLAVMLSFLAVYCITITKARGAIRREMSSLSGENEREPWEEDRF